MYKKLELNSHYEIINPLSVSLIEESEFKEIAKENREHRSINGHGEDGQLQGYSPLSYSYQHQELSSEIYKKYRLRFDNVTSYRDDWKERSDRREKGCKIQKYHTGRDKFIKFKLDRDGSYYKPFNLLSYFNLVFGQFFRKLDEFDFCYKEISILILNFKNMRIIDDRVHVNDVVKLSALYNLFVANLQAIFEYIDLFIVIDYLFFGKKESGDVVKGDCIQLQVDRSQRIKSYLEFYSMSDMYRFYQEIKDERDFLLHKGNGEFLFYKNESGEVVIRIGNSFIADKVNDNYGKIGEYLDTFLSSLLKKFEGQKLLS